MGAVYRARRSAIDRGETVEPCSRGEGDWGDAPDATGGGPTPLDPCDASSGGPTGGGPIGGRNHVGLQFGAAY